MPQDRRHPGAPQSGPQAPTGCELAKPYLGKLLYRQYVDHASFPPTSADGGPVGRDLLFVARWSNLISCASLKQLLLLDNASGRAEVGRFRQARDYANVLAAHAGREFPRRQNLQADDIVNIQFTSGTTSSPKAACLTHRNVLNNGFFVGQGMALTDTDIICCPPPMYHCFGQVLGLMTAMTHGKFVVG